MTADAILKELSYSMKNTADIVDFLDEATELLNNEAINEAEYNKVSERLKLDLFDVDKFVKVNNCQPITNPRAFERDGVPSDDGLLSEKIFGTTMEEKAGTFAYIDLHDWFIQPACYKAWTKIDSNVAKIVHGIDYYKVNARGEFEKDPSGETGLSFLKKNIDKINFKNTTSIKRDIRVKFLEQNRDKMFINKYIVIPPYYRDKNSTGGGKTVGLGGINKTYNNLIIASNSLVAATDYFFESSQAMKARVQELIQILYDWFCGNNNKNIAAAEAGVGLGKKTGLIHMSGMSKTTDFSSRLVISGPELKAERPEDMLVDYEHTAIPLASVITQFRDFVLFQMRRFFDNHFLSNNATIQVVTKDGHVEEMQVDSPEIAFSDERLRYEMERFLHGYNNRFVPIEVPVVGTDKKYYMRFVGNMIGTDRNPVLINRRITWCDIFFITASEAIRNKHIVITRFPIDKYTNQITTKIRILSTKHTEPMIINGQMYEQYPRIREEDIGTDTSNSFIDTLQMSNLYLKGLGGDYDGDQVTCKGIYTEEANEELEDFMTNSKVNYVDFGCKPTRPIESDVVQAIYALTLVLHDTKLTENIEFS